MSSPNNQKVTKTKYGIYFAYWEQESDADYLPYVKKVRDLGFAFGE